MQCCEDVGGGVECYVGMSSSLPWGGIVGLEQGGWWEGSSGSILIK